MTPCIYELLQAVYSIPSRRMNYSKQYIPSQVAESPRPPHAADLLLAVSPKAVAYLLVPPPADLLFKSQSCCKLQHYIPISGLALLPKWRPRYMGFIQLDHPIAGYRAM